MRKRLKKKKIKQIAEEFSEWYMKEFIPLRDKKREEFKNKRAH